MTDRAGNPACGSGGAHVFLDLDGTLTESGIGITRSIAHALAELGHEVPAQSVLDRMIGPSLWEVFATLGIPDARLDEAVAAYRARYTTIGLLENRVYDGIPEMMAALSGPGGPGATLSLATAKPTAYATKITAHFGLSQFLRHEFGSELDGTRSDKTDLIAHALEQTGADPARSVMVGDRRYDMIGAINNGVTPVGAGWGYGTPAELRDAGCRHIAATPMDAAETIRKLLS